MPMETLNQRARALLRYMWKQDQKACYRDKQVKDWIEIQRLLEQRVTHWPSHLKRPRKLKKVLKAQSFNEINHHRLVQAMLAPLRRQLNYVGMGRRIFQVEPLPPVQVIYDQLSDTESATQ